MMVHSQPYEQGHTPPAASSSQQADADGHPSPSNPDGSSHLSPSRSRYSLPGPETETAARAAGSNPGPSSARFRARATSRARIPHPISPHPNQIARDSSPEYKIHAASFRGGPMSYRDYPPAQNRTLIDRIPDSRYDDLDASDEDDAFYTHEDDYIIHPKWRAAVTRTANRVPRRIQRYLLICIPLFIIFVISWCIYLGPRYSEYRQEQNEMDSVPNNGFGTNLRPVFKDLTHLKDLDEKHLPKGQGRLIAVGDVHGCREELEELLQKVDFQKGRDHLVLAGDMVAKGPDSPGVVTLAQNLGASCVRGNHEDKLLLSVAESNSQHHPELPGPDEPASREKDYLDEESFSHGDYKLRKLARQFSPAQISWLQACPVILRVGHVPSIGNSVVVVHAGLVPDIPLESQDPYHVMNMRTVNLKTRLPSEGREGKPWEKLWNHRQKKLDKEARTTVVYGHDRKRGMNLRKYSMGLDSGCVSGGRLTAMVISESSSPKYVQVKCGGKGGGN